jgi:hypothetical protein
LCTVTVLDPPPPFPPPGIVASDRRVYCESRSRSIDALVRTRGIDDASQFESRP